MGHVKGLSIVRSKEWYSCLTLISSPICTSINKPNYIQWYPMIPIIASMIFWMPPVHHLLRLRIAESHSSLQPSLPAMKMHGGNLCRSCINHVDVPQKHSFLKSHMFSRIFTTYLKKQREKHCFPTCEKIARDTSLSNIYKSKCYCNLMCQANFINHRTEVQWLWLINVRSTICGHIQDDLLLDFPHGFVEFLKIRSTW